MRKTKQLTAIYARTATDDQAGTSCDQQVKTVCRGAGLAEGEAALYADAASSGLNARRPQLRRLIDDARRGLVNRILVSDFSRLARDATLLTNILKELKEVGTVVETIERTPVSG